MKFTEEPFAWIGVHTWPFTQPYHQAKLWGKLVVFGLVPAILLIVAAV